MAQSDVASRGQAPAAGLLDIVTVVYAAEVPLLQLQARSIARFLDPEGIGAIFVIVNDREEDQCLAQVRAMVQDYGAFAERVEIVRPAELFALRPEELGPRGLGQRARSVFTANRWRYPFGVKGGWRGNRGWSVQQALKLAIARRGSGATVLILDAKNHFVRPVSRDSFVAPDGRARARLSAPNRKHLKWNRACYRFFGFAPPEPGAANLPTVTPFVVSRADLSRVLGEIELRVGPVEAFFSRNRGRESEFGLINAGIANRPGGLEAAFAPGLKRAASIRLRHDADRVSGELAAVEAGEADILSVHKRRLGRIAPDQLARLRAIWSAAGLDAEELILADVARRKAAPR